MFLICEGGLDNLGFLGASWRLSFSIPQNTRMPPVNTLYTIDDNDGVKFSVYTRLLIYTTQNNIFKIITIVRFTMINWFQLAALWVLPVFWFSFPDKSFPLYSKVLQGSWFDVIQFDIERGLNFV